MPLYFLLHDAGRFRREVRPALSEAWRRRSFEPCRALCAALAPAAADFAARYHTGADEPLLARAARGDVPFDRDLWRLLVGEALLYAATAVPEVPTAVDALRCLLAPSHAPARREEFDDLARVHYGSRDLVFAGAYYRPESAGYSDADDVGRLAGWLQGVDVTRWRLSDLSGMAEFDDGERAEELEFARDVAFPALRDLYRQARDAGQVVVCEIV